tara:strand:+ start:12778 stop:14046 length:1269 start_codon:yes stop_codon:yes gene_type:complete
MRLSIIIPIYNSEKYLQNCLKSICQQITKEIEIILVNDASKDGSVKICNSFKKNFQNIKLINLKKNSGVSFARNIGIKMSSGEYLCFIDSDDEILPKSLKNILDHIKNFDFNLFVLRNFVLRTKKVSSKNKSFELIPNDLNNSIMYSTNCWNFIINKNFLNRKKIFFKNLKVTEDWVFVIDLLCSNKDYKIIKKPVYLHRMFEPNTLGKKAGYLIAVSRLKVIYEIGKILAKKKLFLSQQKIRLIKRLLKVSVEQMYSNLLLCNLHQLYQISKLLKNYKAMIIKLSRLNFNSLNKIYSKKSIERYLIKYKSENSKFLKKIIKKDKNNNIIIFCAGGYGKTALKILINSGAKVNSIIDNNKIYNNKQIESFKIRNPGYLKRNLKKFNDYKIFVCNKKLLVFKNIKLQLKKIGFADKNIIHFNV